MSMLGVIPLGTANDFARTLGIPVDLEAATEHRRRRATSGWLTWGGLTTPISSTSRAWACRSPRRPSSRPRSSGGSGRSPIFTRGLWLLRETRRSASTSRMDLTRSRPRPIQLVVGNGRFYGGACWWPGRARSKTGSSTPTPSALEGGWQLLTTIAMLRLGVPIDRPGDYFLQTPALQVETWPRSQSQLRWRDPNPIPGDLRRRAQGVAGVCTDLVLMDRIGEFYRQDAKLAETTQRKLKKKENSIPYISPLPSLESLRELGVLAVKFTDSTSSGMLDDVGDDLADTALLGKVGGDVGPGDDSDELVAWASITRRRRTPLSANLLAITSMSSVG